MKIYCKELDQEFNTEKEMFEALKKNKASIVTAKKAQIYKSFEKDNALMVKAKSINSLALSKLGDAVKNQFDDDDYYYIAVNSTRILDSHKDLHVDGLWKRTVKNQQGHNYLVDTHVMSMMTTIVRKEKIQMFTAIVPFSFLNKDYPGDTEILVYKFLKEDVISPLAKDWLESGDDIQASVRMQYVNVELCMNSEAKGDEKYLERYLKYVSTIANKDDFETINYFWAVTEAKNVGESSLVLRGSNHVTGVVEENTKGLVIDTPKDKNKKDNEDSQESTLSNYRKLIIND